MSVNFRTILRRFDRQDDRARHRFRREAFARAGWFIWFVAYVLPPNAAHAFLYRAPQGTLKDNCVIWHDGKYYLFTMYRYEQVLADDAMQWRHMWLATSTDGVHWQGVGPVIRDAPFGVYAMRIWKVGDRFVMNHGSFTGNRQDVLRFWESKDLVHWQYLGKEYDVRRPDGQRLDHMDVVSLTEGGKTAWYGYAAGGVLRSDDGVKWKWTADFAFTDNLRVRTVQEPGGCERIGDRYYLLVGGFYPGSFSYSVATFIADNPTGPFRPDYPAFRLNGNDGRKMVGLWAGYCRTPKELLITNYIVDPSGLFFWHAPLKKAVVDKEGHLRLGYWSGNAGLKAAPVAIDPARWRQVHPVGAGAVRLAGNRIEMNAPPQQPVWWQIPAKPRTAMALLDNAFDVNKGIILEGRMRVVGGSVVFPALGLILEERPGEGTAILFETWEQTEIGKLIWRDEGRFIGEDRTSFGCATAAGIPGGRTCSFRLLFRKDLFEVYLDDLLVQTWSTDHATGRVGVLVQDGQGVFEDVRAWQMGL
jgi:hypothetical protein